MTVLPSFVQLMDSLGLEQLQQQQSPPSSPDLSSSSPSPPPPSSSPNLGCNKAPSSPSPTQSRSSPSLREPSSSRSRSSRYSPYSTSCCTRRPGSSSPSSSEFDLSNKDSTSPPPTMSSFRARRSRNQLTINICGSVSDLPAYTPISSYVRRKTPGASPTSPIFPRLSYDSVDITLPMLPDVLPSSASSSSSSSSSFPPTPTSPVPAAVEKDMTMTMTMIVDADRSQKTQRRWHTGVRISTPPFTSCYEDGKRRRVILTTAQTSPPF